MVANTHAVTISLVATDTMTVEANIAVGDSPVQGAVDPDARYAYVSLAGDSAVAKVDLEERTVVKTVNVSAAPVELHLTPDGSTLISADQGSEDEPGESVSVIDVDTMTVTTTIPTGSGPHCVVIDPSGTRAWVTNLYDDTVSVLDLTTRTAVATIDVGALPNGISFSARRSVYSSDAVVDVPDYSGEAPESHDDGAAHTGDEDMDEHG